MVFDLYPYIAAIVGVTAMVVVWALVQLAWRRTFPGCHDGGDVLASRDDCGRCAIASHCDRVRGKTPQPPPPDPQGGR